MSASTAAAATLGEPSGTGPWPAVAESRAELPGHTVYHPVRWPAQPMPLYVWGNGACRDNGLAYGAYLRQLASNGYFVVPVGHRLRFVVTGADPRQRNLKQIRQDPAPTIRLALGGANGSRIELPLTSRTE